MLGVTKEVPKMADYYLKTDNIMKNMFTVALKDELAAQSQMGKVRPATEAMLQKVCSYELSEKRLPITTERGTAGTSQCPQSAAGQVSCHGQVQRRH